LSIFVFSLSFLSSTSFARTNITDWYIKNYETEIVVNKDSSLLITEKITADCDSLPNKHGIFRILPYEIKTDQGIIKMPIKLISITDFNGHPYKYLTINDFQNKTITWKIGDQNKTVTGENNYQIVYQVNNAIRFSNESFDEFYYNLLGGFWQMDIDNFSAKIIFPEEIKKDDTQIYLYSGYQGEKTNFLADYYWINDNVLLIHSKMASIIGRNTALAPGEGITISIIMPKGIFKQPLTFQIFLETCVLKMKGLFVFIINFNFKKQYFWFFLLPFIFFIISFQIWGKYGKEPKYNKKPIIPEYDVPDNLTPLEASFILNNFKIIASSITATLIFFATKGLITIEEKRENRSIFSKTNIIFHQIASFPKEFEDLKAEKFLFNLLFNNDGIKQNTLQLLGKEFRKPGTQKHLFQALSQDLDKKIIVSDVSLNIKRKYNSWASVFIILLYGLINLFFLNMISFIIFSIIIIMMILFSNSLARITLKGQEIIWRLQGFKLYLETAEKYREQFYEKENIFEKFLPYAIAFGMTKLWITKMKQIYGEQYMNNYVPGWYASPSGLPVASMNFDSFAASLSHISSSMSSSIGGSSGGGGGGSSGGGGGGGGGGW